MKVQSSWLVALLVIPLFGITGCTTTKTVRVLSEPVNSVALNPPNIRDLELQGVKWFIVTPENIDEVFKELEDQNKDVRYAKGKIISVGNQIDVLKEHDIIHYDKHAGHGIQWKDKLYYVLKIGDVVLVE